MSLYKKGAFIILLSIACYLVGNWVPIEQLRPAVESAKLKTPEYLQLIVGTASALVTLLAVLVALFKEEIIKNWRYAKIIVTIPDYQFFEELNSSLGSSSDSIAKSLIAIGYNSKIEIVNKGSISAFDLEIYLDSLIFESEDHPNTQILASDPKFIKWNESSETKINLSPEGKRTLDVIYLSSPTQQSSPEGDKADIPAKLSIAGIDINSN